MEDKQSYEINRTGKKNNERKQGQKKVIDVERKTKQEK